MADVVLIGEDGYISDTTNTPGDNNGGKADWGGLQVGYAYAEYHTESDRAEAHCDALYAGLGSFAWAEIWTEFAVFESVNGEISGEAKLNITGKYRGEHGAILSATSSLDVNAFIRDLDSGDKIASKNIMHSDAYVIAALTKEDEFDINIVANEPLEAGNNYAVGIRVKTTSTADGPSSSSATFHPVDDDNHGEIYSSNIEWI